VSSRCARTARSLSYRPIRGLISMTLESRIQILAKMTTITSSSFLVWRVREGQAFTQPDLTKADFGWSMRKATTSSYMQTEIQ
jgi:hypothetical protein